MFKLNTKEALLITKPEHQHYLTGFYGEGFVLVTKDQCYLATDQRYWILAKKEKQKQVKLFEISTGWPEKLQKLLKNIRTLHYEDHHMTVASLARWRKMLPKKTWKKVGLALEEKRMIKSPDELEKLRKAAQIGDSILKKVLKEVKPGVTEKSLANRLRQLAYEHANGVSFDPIVAFGENAAIPHHHSGQRKLKKNDAILIDQGVKFEGYMSDMTRCFFVGKGIPEVKAMHQKLLQAQKAAVEMVRPGVLISDLSTAARALLGKDAKYFTHSLGHGVGLEIHESPGVSTKNPLMLEAGMVITIEPGLYKEKIGGVRIEDTVIVTEEGCEVITKSSKTPQL